MSGTSTVFEQLKLKLAKSLIACRANSSKRAVHEVRTGARRLEALLNKTLEDHPDASALHRTMKKTLRQLKRIRKAAGPVRDFDVHRKLARQINREMLSHKDPMLHEDVVRDYEHLDSQLAKKREQGAATLRKDLTKSELPLEQALELSTKEIAALTAHPASPLATARKWVQRSSGQFRKIDKVNLHDYRKQTKAARYVAELQTSPAAQRFAQRLHHVQEAIGKWHDWDLLTQEARDILGKRASTVTELKKKRDHALTAALLVERADAPMLPPSHKRLRK